MRNIIDACNIWIENCILYQKDILHGDEKALTVINKDYFISLVESYTKPRINGNRFYDSFVLSQAKIKNQLRKNENIVWRVGANKERLELRPFIGLEDGNVLISYGVLEQAIQLWVSYFANGGMCYSNVTDNLSKARNFASFSSTQSKKHRKLRFSMLFCCQNTETVILPAVPSRFMRKIVCRLRLSEVSRQ